MVTHVTRHINIFLCVKFFLMARFICFLSNKLNELPTTRKNLFFYINPRVIYFITTWKICFLNFRLIRMGISAYCKI